MPCIYINKVPKIQQLKDNMCRNLVTFARVLNHCNIKKSAYLRRAETFSYLNSNIFLMLKFSFYVKLLSIKNPVEHRQVRFNNYWKYFDGNTIQLIPEAGKELDPRRLSW